jgi:ABC-type uncharacterized transport system auxiliary subunit
MTLNPSPRLAVSCLAIALLTGGCLSKPRPDIEYYNFNLGGATRLENKFGSVFVRDFYINPAFEDKNFVYQTGEFSYESDFYHQLQLSPRAAFSTAARRYLADSGLFASVITPVSAVNAEFIIEGNVGEFYADFRDRTVPVARLSVEFLFYQSSRGKPLAGDPLLKKTYRQSIPISGSHATDVITAWNQAYQNILRQFTGDLAAVETPAAVNGQ